MIGKIVFFVLALSLASGVAFGAPGDLDLSFNAPTGFVFYDPGLSANGVAVQEDGRIVVVGTSSNGMNNDMLILRYLENGLFDPSFGNGGVVTFDGPAGYIDNAKALAIQADGKIVVAGSSHGGPSQFDAMVLRLTGNGIPDPDFGGGDGLAVFNTPGNGNEFASDVLVQPDGKIVVVGKIVNSTDSDVLILRYNSNGTPDAGFGINGVVTYNHGTKTDEEAYSAALQPDGKIVVTGYTKDGPDTEIILVLRFNSNGTLDNNFGGGDGVVTYSSAVPGPDMGFTVAVQRDGKIVVGGVLDLTDLLVLRFNANGTVDAGFGTDGVATFSGPLSGLNKAVSVVLQPDGKIVVGGSAQYEAPDLIVLRYSENGSLDDTFAEGGVFRYNGPARIYADDASAVAIDPDGKIIVAGNIGSVTGNDIITMRLVGQERLMVPVAESVISYPQVVQPYVSVDPLLSKPIGLGPVAAGNPVLDLQVGLHSLSGPVDVYLAIHAPVLDPNTFFIIKPDNSVQPHTEGIVPWRSATEGPLSLSLYGPVPIEGLAAGTYYFYAVVLPHGAPGGYYLWQTSFTVP